MSAVSPRVDRPAIALYPKSNPKGVGKIYVQVVVDAYCSLVFAKLYTSKMPITEAELLYDHVLPFYEALGVPVQAVLTDNGQQYCGRPERHPYELLLALHAD